MAKKPVLTKEMIESITRRLIEMEGEELPSLGDTPSAEDLDVMPDLGVAWYVAYKTTSAVSIDVSDIKGPRSARIDVTKK
ncbi:MAG: hypothetical protein ACSHX3_14255 [Litorimonas sp.]